MADNSTCSRRTLLRFATVGSLFGLARGVALANALNSVSRISGRDRKSELKAAREDILGIMAAHGIPGAAVMLVCDGEPLWIEGFGVTDSRENRRVDQHTIFSLQSISKNFTATAIMLAVQDRLLDLDKPITTYIPSFRVNSRYEPAPQEKMTLRLLLSHRAGFTHEAPVGNNYDPESPGFEAHVLSISDTWLRYPVGERYSYSNLGVDLAGYILQKISGIAFGQWVKARIFYPLNMTDSTAVQDVYVSRVNRALGHAPGHDTVPLRTPLIPSGGVHTSAADLARYARFHLEKGALAGKRILRKDLWEEMHSFPYGGSYSLGVARIDVRYEKELVRIFNHDGGGFGFGATYNYCPQARLAWAVLFNATALGSASAFQERAVPPAQIRERAFSRFGKKVPSSEEKITPSKMSSDVLQQYVGNYLGGGYDLNMILEDNTLSFKWDTGVNKLTFTSPDEALITDGPWLSTKLRYHPAHGVEMPHFELKEDGSHFDYNDGPNDVTGPIGTEYDHLLGSYQIETWGKPAKKILSKKNGYLYLDSLRLAQYVSSPFLFFTGDGEALDFRSREPTFRSIRLKKLAGA